MGGAGKKAEEELLGRWAGLGRKQRRGYWGGGRGWEETEVSQVTSRGLAWWRPLRWPPEWQLRSCRDGLCQPDKRHRRKRRLGHNHGRDAQSSGETLGLRHRVCASAPRAEGDGRRLVWEESRVRGTCPGQSTGNRSPGVSSSFPDHELCLQVSHSTPWLHPDGPAAQCHQHSPSRFLCCFLPPPR